MSNLVKALLVCGMSVVIATGTIVGFANPTEEPAKQVESTKATAVCEEVIADDCSDVSHTSENKNTQNTAERNHDNCYDNGFDYGYNLAFDGYPDDFNDDGLIVCCDENDIVDCSVWVEGFEEGCKWGEAGREAVEHGHPEITYMNGCEEDEDEVVEIVDEEFETISEEIAAPCIPINPDTEDTLVTTEDELEKPDEYDPETGNWAGDGEHYDPESGLDEYDWGLEHGKWSEAREEHCRDCGVWAKYGTCLVCGEEVE